MSDIEEIYNENQEDEDQFENILRRRNNNEVWKSKDSHKKDKVIGDLLKCFSAMVKATPKDGAIPDDNGRYRPEDNNYEKLIDCSKYVLKAKRLLLANENFDTRDFTIYISNQRWVRGNFRPLLELCAKDDSSLAMRCCGLALVLVKRLSEKAMKTLQKAPKQRKKSANDLTGDEEGDKSGDEKSEVVSNARQQMSALLSFKEALCSALCNEALTNAFREYWTKEQEVSTEDNKTQVAICFGYIRRVLSIHAHPHWSTPGEITAHHRIHHQYISHLRQILSVIPGICSDLGRKYHDDWLGDIILIVYFALQDFDPKQLFLAYKTNSLIPSFRSMLDDSAIDDSLDAKSTHADQPVIVPASFRQSIKTDTKGSLLGMLKKETASRMAKVTAGCDSSRFRAVFRVNMPVHTPSIPVHSSSDHATSDENVLPRSKGSSSNDTTAQDSAVGHATQTAKIFSNPFAPETAVPQVKSKSSKRSLAFSVDTVGGGELSSTTLTGQDFQTACIVAASLTDLLTYEVSLKSLVRRVNEDLRREELTVVNDLELKYFSVLTKLLSYHRLKLNEQLLKHTATNSGAPWEPGVKNVMDTLDRMSFNRVLGAIENCLDPRASQRPGASVNPLGDVHIPMALFKEMVCYLRVLLESGIEGHHEIAVAAMFRLYYSAGDRIDPLPKLLTNWKAGTFSRHHTEVLVELVHETLATLEAAHNLYKDEESVNKRRKLKKGKDMDLESYILACMRFDVNEYFRRIVTNNCVRMYTKLLNNYDTNDAQVNRHAFAFLQRMCGFKLEQMYKALPKGMTSAVNYEPVHLGFMLFNLQTLLVFSNIMNDPEVHVKNGRLQHLQPLVSLIALLVRRLGDASSKNTVMFDEILFQHVRPDQFCLQLDSIYEAPLFASSANGHSSSMSGTKKKKRDGNYSDDSRSADSSDEDFGDEFDENALSRVFNAPVAKVPSKKDAERKKKGQSRDEEKRVKRSRWSEEEDDVLRDQFLIYEGLDSMYTMITECPELRNLGGNRSQKQVKERLRYLNSLSNSNASDRDNGEMEDDLLRSPSSVTNQRQRTHRSKTQQTKRDEASDGDEDEAVMLSEGEDDLLDSSSPRLAKRPHSSDDDDNDNTQPQVQASPDSKQTKRQRNDRVSAEKDEDDTQLLPRAAWDTDDLVTQFDQRSRSTISKVGSSSNNNNSTKKLTRQQKQQQRDKKVDSDDDLFNADSSDEMNNDYDTNHNSSEIAVTQSQSTTKKVTAKSRAMQIASDDDEEDQ